MTYRVVKFIIQPVIVHDDGDALTEVPAEPIVVPGSLIAEFPARFAAELATMPPPGGRA